MRCRCGRCDLRVSASCRHQSKSLPHLDSGRKRPRLNHENEWNIAGYRAGHSAASGRRADHAARAAGTGLANSISHQDDEKKHPNPQPANQPTGIRQNRARGQYELAAVDNNCRLAPRRVGVRHRRNRGTAIGVVQGELLTALCSGSYFKADAAAVARFRMVAGKMPIQNMPAMQAQAVSLAGAESSIADKSFASLLQKMARMTPK
jgi:hypothetical protein